MRMLFIIVGAVIVLGGGAAGAYFYFSKPAEASASEKTDDHAGDAHGGAHGSDFEYVELDPLILPIVDENGLSQTVSLVIAIEVTSGFARSKVESLKPRLKDAYIQDLYGVLNKHAALKGGVIQIGLLKDRLNKVSQRVTGEDTINDVLLQVVQQRPI